MCKYYNKTFTNKKSPFAKMALMESRNLHNIGITTWFSTLACLTDKYNIQTDKEIDIPLTISTLQATYKDKWLERINTSEKLRTYRTFKPTHKMEAYLNTFKDVRKRALISKIWISAHTLEIEVGRHKQPKIPALQRFCKKCSTSVEDEKHFLLACPAYDTVCPNFIMLNDTDKLIWLMSADDQTMITQLACFINKASNIISIRQS